jgi:thiamine-phosphate pyrophosphorylase
MFPDCTPAVARALEIARQRARHQATDVQPLHIIAGLVEDKEGPAARLLLKLGVTTPVMQQTLPGDSNVLPTNATPAPPMSSSIQLAFARARELMAESRADQCVGSEQLLLALLQVDAEVVRLLQPLGLEVARLNDEINARQAPPLHLEEPLDLAEPTERIDAARILDANANRAREALRVVEDYCRFVLDDAFLAAELKKLRHDLTEALSGMSPAMLLEARETQQDVGTALSTSRERERHSLQEVALINLKRLQEALRSLEEVGKITSGHLGQALKQVRYRSYTLERAILLGSDARRRLADARLYVILTGSQCKAALDWTIHEAAAGGAAIFQLREKNLNDRDLLERARQVRRWTRETGTLFIMNDRPDIARLADADGVHVGQEELPVKEARRIVGPNVLIGVSTHNISQVRQAVMDGASYIGVGPTFPSGTKEFPEYPGLHFVRQALTETSLPTFVIGGITLDNITQTVAAGACRVAVSQAVCQSDDPRSTATALCQALAKQEKTSNRP